jgi:inosine/xanthosine triphosphate pyrophosphatase family protein
MSERPIINIVYATSSAYKAEEIKILREKLVLDDGVRVKDRFSFDLRAVEIKEPLEVNLKAMVCAEVEAAYRQLRVPCIVEHAGLIFADYLSDAYPGGLTKPMWNTLGKRFPQETQSADRPAFARAVVAYCDGQQIKTFSGETKGVLASEPRGGREFYWDTVFIPNDDEGNPGSQTYAEIVADTSLGLEHKVLKLSQSTKAMSAFLAYRLENAPELWTNV